jgi:hypothetical protein
MATVPASEAQYMKFLNIENQFLFAHVRAIGFSEFGE